MKEHFIYYLHQVKKNEKGFLFPYIFIVFFTVLLIVHQSLQSLNTERELVRIQEEQIILESLMLSGYNEFYSNLHYLTPTKHDQALLYSYPDGQVHITYSAIDKSTIKARFELQTINDSPYTVTVNLPFLVQGFSE
ncbi:competence type IV pilus minor pilin ComGG [Salinibacillus xinjiangensis]|uniref:Competence protein ComG n=1 Tax=Salinibacillus xinjiangensis TaxID=1229268 RepID=A0A6G1X6S0_9BACI|nr:competence type IV pilus minor pilin ComGG [Salinibacillus xinjiangensis]MRG86580.1 hypothetical protein [Salinibacillus xinjiangensis]